MGNKNSVVKNNCIEELNNIDENDLDISNKKSDRIMYKLPSINLCAPSLI